MKRILLSGVLFVAAAGCTNPCVSLAEKICACQPTTTAKDACVKAANDELANINLSGKAEDFCDSKVDGCDCDKFSAADPAIVAQAKQACGLAR